jgi:hypothetical protein
VLAQTERVTQGKQAKDLPQYFTATPTTIAGGGGASSDGGGVSLGKAGGGNGGSSNPSFTNGGNASANSGSGGGGAYANGGGNGGTGVVFIRYLTAQTVFASVTASGGTSAAAGDYTVWTFTSTGSITFA